METLHCIASCWKPLLLSIFIKITQCDCAICNLYEMSVTGLLKQERFLQRGRTAVRLTGQVIFVLEWVKTKPNITD